MQELQQDQKKSINLCGPNGTQPSEMDYKEGMYILLKHIVDLHSEMILLLNLWNINQTGTVFFSHCKFEIPKDCN